MVTTRQQSGESRLSVEEQFKLLKDEHNDIDLSKGSPMELPHWFEREKFERGQAFFRENFFALFVSKLAGLLVVLCVPNILKVLVMTDKSSVPKTAFKRYFSTLKHMIMWYNGDITDTTSHAYRSLSQVNAMHLSANKQSKKACVGTVSQSSLALTQFGFMGYALLASDKLGLHVTNEQDLEGFVHFWRTIGHMIGLQERFNICREDLKETKELCQMVLDNVYKPRLEKPDPQFLHMSKAILNGMWAMVPHLNDEAFLNYTNYLSGIQEPNHSNWYSKMVFTMQIFVHEVLLTNKILGKFFRAYFNFNLWLSVVITSYYPFLAYYAFGRPL